MTINSVNKTDIKNMTSAYSNTGKNITRKGGSIYTGEAIAMSDSVAQVGLNDIEVKAPDKGKLTVNNVNESKVYNSTVAKADTGNNKTYYWGGIKTGDATAVSGSVTVVGSNMLKVN